MLTEKITKEADARAKPYILWDTRVKGFGMRTFPKGRKSFVIMYRLNGVLKLVTLGRVDDLPLKEARARAASELSTARLGKDDLATRKQDERNAPRFAEVWARFENEFAPEQIALRRMTTKTLKDYRNIIKAHALPVLGAVKVKDVTRADVERVGRRMLNTPTMRNRALAVMSRLFSLCELWGLRPQHTNPCRGITRTREQARDRVLNEHEMKKLNDALLALKAEHPFEVSAIYAASMTGLRISEVLSLRWEHVDMVARRAVLPTTKTGRRVIVLAAPLCALLRGLPRFTDSEWVFPSSRPTSKATYYQTHMVFGLACDTAKIVNCRLHDLRRSFLTMLAGAGFSAFQIRDTAGHKTLQMASRYVQAGAGLIEASEHGAAAVAAALTGKQAKAVKFGNS